MDFNVGKNIRFGELNWVVIENNNGHCLLLCQKTFSCAWDTSYRIDYGESVDWPNCELYDWLNDDFRNYYLNENEQLCICEGEQYYGHYKNKAEIFILDCGAHDYYVEKICKSNEKYENLRANHPNINPFWYLDSSSMFDSETDPLMKCNVRPAIWIDICLAKELGVL